MAPPQSVQSEQKEGRSILERPFLFYRNKGSEVYFFR